MNQNRVMQPETDRPYPELEAGVQLTAVRQLDHAAAGPSAPAAAMPVRSGLRRPEKSSRPKASWLGVIQRPMVQLAAILVLQVALSLRLIWSDTAFPDEALYLWAGHLEWAHWLHGAPVPPFATFFSGAPALYPPIGAIADHLGGLAGARLLSLGFMLVASTMLYAVTRRLFGVRSALFAVAIFACLAPAQYLGAFATYDAMALMLVTVAAWLGVRAADEALPVGVLCTAGSASVLVLADATKYAAALFTPVVVVMVVAVAWWRNGRRSAAVTAAVMIASCCVCLVGALRLGGHPYWQGITSTTLARESGSSSRVFLLWVSAKWEGAVVVLALIGAAALITRWRRDRAMLVLACLLAATPFLVPIEQARIETYTSLFKHIAYGAWFGAILGGYALMALQRAVPARKGSYALRVSIATLAVIAVPQIPWASSHYGWPDTATVTPVIGQVLEHTKGPLLTDDRGNVLDYYLPAEVGSRPIDGTFFFAFNDPVSGRHLTETAAYDAAVRERYFSVIYLEFWDSAPEDDVVQAAIKRYGGYRVVAEISYPATGDHGKAVIWVRDAAGDRQ